jgi:cholesterol transport system auxiliary component
MRLNMDSRKKLLLAWSVILVSTMSGCVSFGGGKAPAALLVLTAQNAVTQGTKQTGTANQALVVLMPDVPRKLDTNRVPVQVDSSNIAYLKGAIWADKPARLMQLLLMETIAAKNNRLVLNEIDAGGKANEFVSGSLLEFGVDAQASQAVVVYDAVKLVRGQAIEKRRFEARENVGIVEAGPAGSALNKAANTVASDIAAWLN